MQCLPMQDVDVQAARRHSVSCGKGLQINTVSISMPFGSSSRALGGRDYKPRSPELARVRSAELQVQEGYVFW